MSWQATEWAIRQQTGSPSAKALLLALAHYADAAGRCWPSQSALKASTELSMDTVQRATARLLELGLITTERRRHGGRWPGLTYQLTMPHHAARSESTMPHHAASPCRTVRSHHAAPCGTNSQREQSKEQSSPPIPPEQADPPKGSRWEKVTMLIASGEGVLDGEVLPPEPELTFDELWGFLIGEPGKSGPARVAYRSLTASDRKAIAAFARRDGRIDLQGTWLSTWLRDRVWERPPLETASSKIASAFFAGPRIEYVEVLPGTPEWQDLRAGRLARGENVRFMDQRAAAGKGVTIKRMSH